LSEECPTRSSIRVLLYDQPPRQRGIIAAETLPTSSLVPAIAGYYGGTTANPTTAAYVAHVRCAARAYGGGTVRDLTRCFA